METVDIVKIASLIMTSFGGGALIVVALTRWLGDLWAGRILQEERAKLDTKLEEVRHELGIAKSAYEHHLDLILDYYAMFYRHYRLCQRTASADAHRKSHDGELVYTKDQFIKLLDEHLIEWASQEGRIRLLLPSKILELHEKSVEKFNQFKHAVGEFSPAEGTPRKKELAFNEIHEIKLQLEEGLREFLRTESLLK